jgi:hypothetical protein
MMIWDRWPPSRRTDGSNDSHRLELPWNETSRVIRALQNVVRQIKLDVVFMSELHLDKPMAEKLMCKMKFL